MQRIKKLCRLPSSEYITGGEEAVLGTFGENVETFDGDFAQTLALLEMDTDDVHNVINE